MAPTVLDGDWVFVDRISYHFFRDPSREDIIVVKPRSLDAKIIKRIIGLPGEQIEIANGRVKIKDSRQDQGRILSEVYLSLPSAPTIGANVISLDPKEYFMLGDNRYVSTDSRELGPIDEWNIKGRVFLIFRPKYLSFKFFK